MIEQLSVAQNDFPFQTKYDQQPQYQRYSKNTSLNVFRTSLIERTDHCLLRVHAGETADRQLRMQSVAYWTGRLARLIEINYSFLETCQR